MEQRAPQLEIASVRADTAGTQQQLHRVFPQAPPLAPAAHCHATRGPSMESSLFVEALELAGVWAEAAGPRAVTPPRLTCTSLSCCPATLDGELHSRQFPRLSPLSI